MIFFSSFKIYRLLTDSWSQWTQIFSILEVIFSSFSFIYILYFSLCIINVGSWGRNLCICYRHGTLVQLGNLCHSWLHVQMSNLASFVNFFCTFDRTRDVGFFNSRYGHEWYKNEIVIDIGTQYAITFWAYFI